MSELEDQLGSILKSPEKMAQIMQLAKSFSAGSETKSGETPPQDGPDPRMMAAMMKLMRELSSPDSGTDVLRAIEPYLRKERRERVERAIKIARIAKIAGKAFGEMGEGFV